MDQKALRKILVQRFYGLGHSNPNRHPKVNSSGLASIKCVACGEVAYTTPSGKLDGIAVRYTCRTKSKPAKPAATLTKAPTNKSPKQPTHTDLSIKIYQSDICEYCGYGSTIVGKGCRHCRHGEPHHYNEAFKLSPPPLIRYRDYEDITETLIIDRISEILPKPDLSPINNYETVKDRPKYLTRNIRRYTGLEQTYCYIVTKQAPSGKPYIAPCGCQCTSRSIYYHEAYDATETDLMPDVLYRYDCIHYTLEHRSFILDRSIMD